MNRLVLIGGGVRSGKSAFAVELAQKLGPRRAFIATATPSDDEMKARIDRHRQEREDAFTTVEEPHALAEALATLDAYDVVVIDCLTLWLSNLLLRGDSLDAILAQVDRVVGVIGQRRFHVLVVTNEVGMSLHPTTALGRAFVDVSGWAHQRVSRAADEIYLAVLGTIVPLRPRFAQFPAVPLGPNEGM